MNNAARPRVAIFTDRSRVQTLGAASVVSGPGSLFRDVINYSLL